MASDNNSNNGSNNNGNSSSAAANSAASSGNQTNSPGTSAGSSTGFTPTMTTTAEPASSDLSALLMHAAYNRMLPKAAAITPDQVRDIQLGVGDMIETIIVSEPQMQKYRPDLMKVGDFDMTNLDTLKDCAYGLAYMYTRVRAASGKLPPASVAKLVANRQLMHRHGLALASSGYFDEDQVNELIKGKSHQDLTYDVIGFTNLFLDKGSELDGQTPLKRPQLIAMQAEATAMLSVIGEKEHRKSERAEMSPQYQQFYTLALNTYNEVRDALIYALRKRADAEELLKTIAPSLFEDRGRRPKVVKPVVATPAPVNDDDDDDDVPAATPDPKPAAVTDAATTATRAAAAREPGARETRAGFPGSSPTLTEESDK